MVNVAHHGDNRGTGYGLTNIFIRHGQRLLDFVFLRRFRIMAHFFNDNDRRILIQYLVNSGHGA